MVLLYQNLDKSAIGLKKFYTQIEKICENKYNVSHGTEEREFAVLQKMSDQRDGRQRGNLSVTERLH